MDAAVATAGTVPRRWRLRLPERLPNLKGAWLTAYTIIWAIALALSLAGVAIGTYGEMTTPSAWWPYGFATSQDAQGIRVDAVPSPDVRAAGVKAGDHVVAIDGWQAPHTNPRAAARAHVLKPDGSLTTFTFRRPNSQLFNIRLIRSRNVEEQGYRAAGISPTLVAALGPGKVLAAAGSILAAILLFLRRRREAVPALMSLGFLMFAGIANDPSTAGISWAVVDKANLTGACLFFLALFAFPAGRFEPRWTAVPPFLLPVLVVTWALPQGILVQSGFLLTALVALVARYRKLDPGAERQQLRWAFFGFAVGVALQMTIMVIRVAANASQGEDPRWVAWEGFSSGVLDALTSCAIALGVLVSILRYRLYDADKVIGRSAAYGVLTLSFVALFAGAENLAEIAGAQYFGSSIGVAAGAVGAAIAAAVVVPLHNRVHGWAERHFQKELFHLRHGLPRVVGDLRETSGLESIAAATLDNVMEGVHASRAALVIGDRLLDAREIGASDAEAWLRSWSPPTHHRIDVANTDPLFPVRVPLEAEGHGRVGWLLLGPRPDGSLFGRAECAAIDEIADPVARALQVALSRAERENAIEQRFQTMEKLLKEMRGRVGATIRSGSKANTS